MTLPFDSIDSALCATSSEVIISSPTSVSIFLFVQIQKYTNSSWTCVKMRDDLSQKKNHLCDSCARRQLSRVISGSHQSAGSKTFFHFIFSRDFYFHSLCFNSMKRYWTLSAMRQWRFMFANWTCNCRFDIVMLWCHSLCLGIWRVVGS